MRGWACARCSRRQRQLGITNRQNRPYTEVSPMHRWKQVATIALYALMLLAVLALWNEEAPRFIYVAF